MDWLHQAQTARQNHARRSQMKKLLVPSGFLDQKFEGNLKEVGQIVPDSVRILLYLQNKPDTPALPGGQGSLGGDVCKGSS